VFNYKVEIVRTENSEPKVFGWIYIIL